MRAMRFKVWVLGFALFGLTGCGQVGSRREFVETDHIARQVLDRGPGSDDPMSTMVGLEPVPIEMAGNQPIEVYIGRALAENRGVQAARFKLLAMKERIPQAKALEDPMVTNTIWPFPSNGPQYSIMGYGPYSLMISQQFPWLGTLKLRASVAEQEVQVALAELCEAQLEVVARVKRSYYDLHLAERSEQTLLANRELAVDFVDIARVRYEAGNTSQQDVLRAQNTITEVDAELAKIRQELASARATLARQLHVDPESDLGTLDELPTEELPSRIEALYSIATAARPELRGQLAAIARDVRQAELARLKYKPDITIGIGYMTMSRSNAESTTADGRDNVGFVVGFNLPVYRGKLDAAVREAEAQAVAEARKLEDLRDQMLEDVKRSYAEAQASREVLGLFKGSYLPKSRQALEVALSDYRTGKLDFLSLITAWREVLQVELQIARFQADMGRALADLERAVGTQLAAAPPVSMPGVALEPPPPPPVDLTAPFFDADEVNVEANGLDMN
jgi:outer membrane protein, heavy metal efflux system